MLFPIIALTSAVLVSAKVQERPEAIDWASWHMIQVHQTNQYDADSFFLIHDLTGTKTWSKDDILNLYGLKREDVVGDGSGGGEHEHDHEVISEQVKDHVAKTILGMIDPNNDGKVSLKEWQAFVASGKQLPDFGYGPGYHLDFEEEYEEKHWNQYHREDDPDVLIKHKEDIEHELLHHEHDIELTHEKSPEIRKFAEDFVSEIRLSNVAAKYLI